jgi:hypothetical protein
VILTGDDAEQAPRLAADDRDLSRITLRSRAWWHELFLRAGWRQDVLGRLAQRTLATHPLPARMGWKVFAYTPR